MLNFTATMTIEKADKSKEKLDVSFRFPESSEELTLKKWVQFQQAFNSMPDWILEGIRSKTTGDWNAMQWASYMAEQVKLIAMIGQVQYEGQDWEDAQYEDIAMLPISADDFLVDATATSRNQYNKTLAGLFFFLLERLNSHKGNEDFTGFTYKGISFAVPERYRSASGMVSREMSNISVIEAIEALQIEHVIQGSEMDDSDKLYHTDIGVMAAVCRKVLEDGSLEQMPIDDLERRKFLDERRAFFQDIPANISLDVAFFLTASSDVLGAILILDTFMKQLPPEMLTKPE